MSEKEFLTTEELVEQIVEVYNRVFAPHDKSYKGLYHAGELEYEFNTGFVEGVLAMVSSAGSEREGIEELKALLNKQLVGV
jgi:hypothetical protein